MHACILKDNPTIRECPFNRMKEKEVGCSLQWNV